MLLQSVLNIILIAGGRVLGVLMLTLHSLSKKNFEITCKLYFMHFILLKALQMFIEL